MLLSALCRYATVASIFHQTITFLRDRHDPAREARADGRTKVTRRAVDATVRARSERPGLSRMKVFTKVIRFMPGTYYVPCVKAIIPVWNGGPHGITAFH